MFEKSRLSESELKKIDSLKKILISLDKACQVGEVLDEDVEKASIKVEMLINDYVHKQQLVDSRLYILFEIQSLIFWIRGNENEAYKSIELAYKTYGINVVFSQTGKELYKNYRQESKNQQIKKIFNFEWLPYAILIGIALVVIYAFIKPMIDPPKGIPVDAKTYINSEQGCSANEARYNGC